MHKSCILASYHVAIKQENKSESDSSKFFEVIQVKHKRIHKISVHVTFLFPRLKTKQNKQTNKIPLTKQQQQKDASWALIFIQSRTWRCCCCFQFPDTNVAYQDRTALEHSNHGCLNSKHVYKSFEGPN